MTLVEVETKVRIDNVGQLRKKIQRIAKLKKKDTRSDDYFALKRKFRRHGYPKKAFRIRDNGKTLVVNFKKHLKKYWDKEVVVKEEYEFELNNKEKEKFLALMKDHGFKQWIKKIKTSESYQHKKDPEIVIEINKVKHLGYFMEIEYIVKETPQNIMRAKNKIKNTLDELEIDPKDVDNTGYTKMLWKKGIKDKKYWVR